MSPWFTGLEYSMVQETLKKVQHHDPQLSDKGNTLKKDQGAALKKVKHDDPQPSDKKSQVALKKDQGAATLKKVTTKTLTKDAATLKKDLPERKKLKKTLSDVSVDSWGIPKELASPSKTSETSPPGIWKRKRWEEIEAQCLRMKGIQSCRKPWASRRLQLP